MTKYLKKSLLPLVVLLIPYMSIPSQAMDDEDRNTTIRSHMNMATESEDSIDAPSHSTSSQFIESEESSISLASYVLAPVKFAIQSTYEVVNVARKHPTIFGLYVAMNLTAVAAEYVCYLGCAKGGWFDAPGIYVGCDINQCNSLCTASNAQAQMICKGTVGSAGCNGINPPCLN